jgi:hypothetical protein
MRFLRGDAIRATCSSTSVVDDERKKDGFKGRAARIDEGVGAFLAWVCCLVILTGCCGEFVEGAGIARCWEASSILRRAISSLVTVPTP